jgi:hypothetical protein
MNILDVVPAFLAVCPTIDEAWQDHLLFWGDELDRGDFNDVAVIAHHIVDCFEHENVSEFPAVFALLERCLVEGDDLVRNLAAVGLIEDIQNIGSHRSFGPWVFYEWLEPESRVAWNQLCSFWQQVSESNASGLLDSTSSQPNNPAVDPNDVQDPNLRRLIEQLHRK